MSNSELTERGDAGSLDFLRKRSTGASIGNIDSSDLKPPRLKLLAGQSPEVTDGVPGAVPGNFWITVFNQNLGPMVVVTPILLRKTYAVWPPKTPGSDQKGPLATASDGIHWDLPDQIFKIRYPQNSKEYSWRIGKKVSDHGANKFGSSQPEDKNSKPIATLTYNVLMLVDMPDGSKQLAVMTAARTGVKPIQSFISTSKAVGIDHYFQRYKMVVQKKTGPTGDPYFTFEMLYVGHLTSDKEADYTAGLYQQYSKEGFIMDLEQEAEIIEEASPRASAGPRESAPLYDSEDEIPF